MPSIVDKIYLNRFSDAERKTKKLIWDVLCSDFFQKFVSSEDTVVDIGAGFCEFINSIKAGEKIAIDKLEMAQFADKNVKILQNIEEVKDNSIDVVFMCNFLEHLKTKAEVIKVFSESLRVLKTGGSIMITQPNIRYLYKEYWDFFDHYLPLSDKSLIEALQIVGFDIEKVLPKFLPYTTKSKIPQLPFLVKLYLKIPFIWRIMGRQTFILGRKP